LRIAVSRKITASTGEKPVNEYTECLKSAQAHHARRNERIGLVLGFVGVLVFSLTLPATRPAVRHHDYVFVGLGRSVVAGSLAGATLLLTRAPLPGRHQFKQLLLTAGGVVIGFPALSSWAMSRAPATHGAIVVGLIPLATALFGALLGHERPTRGFWIASATGSALVISCALHEGSGRLRWEDAALLGAVIAGAFGYAQGARLTREIGGWQTISWALVISFPALVFPVYEAAKSCDFDA